MLAGDVVGVRGPLGAGKTRFVQGLAQGLGVADPAGVLSPTFALIAEHPGRVRLFHVDLYRIEREEELVELGLRDTYAGDGVCAVEWFDRFPATRPNDFVEVSIAMRPGRRRSFHVSAHGPRSSALVRAWRKRVAG